MIEIAGEPVFTKDKDTIDLMAHVADYHIKMICETKNIRPVFHLFDGESMEVYLVSWSNQKEKNFYSYMIHQLCVQKGALFLIFISDTWVSKRVVSGPPKEGMKKLLESENEIIPSKDPNRTESIMMLIMYPDGRMDSINAPYVRDDKGFPVFKENPYWASSAIDQFALVKPWAKTSH